MSSPPLMMERRKSAAVESAVDAYATRVLSEASPAEACVDESLGPYVTSLLRCSDVEQVTSIPEFESLLELLEEHCSLSEESATTALTTIAKAVKTGVVPELSSRRSQSGSFQNANFPPVDTYHVDPDTLFSVAVEEPVPDTLKEEEFPPLRASQTENESKVHANCTPLKEDRLIPFDLLGALDDPSLPAAVPDANKDTDAEVAETTGVVKKENESFPPLGAVTTKKHKGKRACKKQADDLAAVLFRSSRVRQSSVDSDNVSRSTGSGGGHSSDQTQHLQQAQQDQYFQQQWSMAIEMLLSLNPELGEEAAAEAALMANADPNIAMYIINQALHAPPVCRHMLNDHCYRSDCQFSHDVEGHTCLFWIRGRCGKGPSCRFLHAFSDNSLEGLQEFMQQDVTALSPGASSAPMAIQTGNLVSHNMQMAYSAPQYDSYPFPSSMRSNSSGFDASAFSIPSSWGEPSSLEMAMNSMHVNDTAKTPANEGSFASIASRGYSGASFTPEESRGTSGTLPSRTQKEKTLRIPQELWHPRINRDAHMFYIPDAMERYQAVSSSVTRDDVIDLHFQSQKTFPIVLSHVLPNKLREHNEIWIVTGTGHGVSRNTHQKGGGALDSAVISWLQREGYDCIRGRDRQGHTGAILVSKSQRGSEML